jgi:two-component system, LytTR family, response regulator
VTIPLRVIVADDERPARSFLTALLRADPDVVVVGEAASGPEAVAMIEAEKPDLALLDWEMPELDGIGVVRALKGRQVPFVVFVTAYDEYAVRAFELNAVDYLLKPVGKERLRETLGRVRQRIELQEASEEQQARVDAAIDSLDTRAAYLERLPVRNRDEVVLVPVAHIASIVAEGELLNITTHRNDRHVITFRLKDLEARLDPARFIRLGRGTIANVDQIARISAMPGGTHVVSMNNGQRLAVSRLQSRVLRERLLKL